MLPESISLEIEFTDEVYLQWPLLTASARIDPQALTEELADGSGGNRDYNSVIQDMMKRRRDRQ